MCGARHLTLPVFNEPLSYASSGIPGCEPPAFFARFPPSIGMILTRMQTGTSVVPRTSTVAEMVFAAGELAITGSKTLQLDVKE